MGYYFSFHLEAIYNKTSKKPIRNLTVTATTITTTIIVVVDQQITLSLLIIIIIIIRICINLFF